MYAFVLLLLFFALASLYYYKERGRYFQEQKVKNRLAYSECVRLARLLHDAKPCTMAPVHIGNKLAIVYREIGIAFAASLLLIVPLGLLLARLSLRPMRDAVEAMDGFINGIVHDINTPLSVIRMNATGLQKGLSDPKLQRKNRRVLQGVEQIEALEEQLLFGLKVGHYELRKSVFDLCGLLHARDTYWASNRSRVSVSVDVPASCRVCADEKALMRMIDNVVGNAVKYSPPQSEVTVRLQGTLLEIQDRGPGIRNVNAVFGKYYRENRSTKGIGLGLYIVAQIADLHGIGIDVSSHPGKGTTFTFRLDSIFDPSKADTMMS